MRLLQRYLEFIGFNGIPRADLKTLEQLHYLHTLKIPFENLTPYLHKEVVLNFEHLISKFIDNSRGGYCFEQNLVFASVLKEIGFTVKTLGGRVLWNQDENLITRRSHMLILVKINQKDYLADVGFGGLTLTSPIRFEVGESQKTTHENFRIGLIENDYKLQAEVGGVWKTLYRFDLTEQYLIDYEVANYYLYTHPESIFRKNLIAAKPVKDGRYALSNNQFTYYPLGADPEKKILSDAAEVKNVLKSIFNLEVEDALFDQKISQS